ncbi:hypothetical protein FI667_g5716, partial [Globisporangium splendens]
MIQKEGQHVRVLQVRDDGWWLGHAVDAPDHVGLFLSNYVRQVQQQTPHVSTPPRYENKEADEEDAEGQERQRRTLQHRQIQQQQLCERKEQKGKEEGADLDDNSEEEDTPTAPQQRMASVLQLKRSLADAERASEAARHARQMAERDRVREQHHRRRRPQDEEEDFGREEREAQEQYRRYLRDPRRHVARYEEEQEDDDEEEAFQYNKHDRDDESEEDDQQEEKEEGREDHSIIAVPVGQQSRMNSVIEAYQSRQNRDAGEADEQDDDDEEQEESGEYNEQELAAARIARQYRHHRMHQEQQQQKRRQVSRVIARTLQTRLHSRQQQRSYLERRHAAALAIQRWVLRTGSQQRKRRAEKEHVEEEREVMEQRNRARLLQLELIKQQEAQEEERYRQEQERERQRRLEIEQQQQASSSQSRKKSDDKDKHTRKKMMKKEAVDLVKLLVKKQLDEKLRDHDERMAELQRLVTTLRDVIRKQSEMLQHSNDHVIELEMANTTKTAKMAQSLLNQAQNLPSSSMLLASSSSSSSLTSSPSAATVKASFIPQLPSRSSLLPAIGNNMSNNTSAAKPIKPSGLRPQRPVDPPSKLPVLFGPNSNRTPKK